MKLEPDLIKEILEWCEEYLPDYEIKHNSDELLFKGFSEEQILYHLELLIDEKYILAQKVTYIWGISDNLKNKDSDKSTLPYKYNISQLTMNGHQYLQLLKSPAWTKAKSLLHETGVIFAEGAINALIDSAKTILIGGK
jgi:hypothetical protein